MVEYGTVGTLLLFTFDSKIGNTFFLVRKTSLIRSNKINFRSDQGSCRSSQRNIDPIKFTSLHRIKVPSNKDPKETKLFGFCNGTFLRRITAIAEVFFLFVSLGNV